MKMEVICLLDLRHLPTGCRSPVFEDDAVALRSGGELVTPALILELSLNRPRSWGPHAYMYDSPIL
jgi:hypothetical protein